MDFPKRFIHNPYPINGMKQSCTWDETTTSSASLTATISSNDRTIRLNVSETRSDDGRGTHTANASVTLSRARAVELMKVLAALI